MIQTLLAAVLLASPPPTATDPVVERMHGVEIVDDYRWLEALEVESERVRDWTTEQNAYTRAFLDGVPGRDALESRLTELFTIGTINAPVARGNTYFHTERRGDQNQPVLYVRDGIEGADRLLLDPNTLDDRGLYALDWFEPSPDGALVAFGLSYAGDEMTVLYLLETESGAWLSDEISGKVEFSGWAPDGRSFLYGKLEDPADAYSRSFRWHEVGRHHRADPLFVMQEAPSRIPNAQLSDDGQWIIVTHFEGWSKQDVLVIDLAAWRRTGVVESKPIAVGLDARFAAQFVHGDTLFLLSTLDAPNAALHAVDLLDPARDEWYTVLAEREDAVLRGVSHARGRIVAEYQRDATTRLAQFDLTGIPKGPVELPGLGSASITTESDRLEAFVTFQSYNEPRTVYRVDLESGDHTVWARPAVPVDPSTVVVKQEWCTSKDGTKVPMFIVHRRGLELDGRNPTLVYGYGGFNVTLTPRFGATTFPWLEAGGVYVSVTLRGGGEFGEAWHQAGMLANKQNVFDDLYAATEHLFERKYTSPDHCALMGGSNGGLLAGVAATQRPDLWSAVISAVPLLDMLRYQHFLMARFWVPEYGDPEVSEQFAWLRAYSPYHNIESGRDYPAILFTAGENDNRVHPMHARKMAAAMQAEAGNDPDDAPILLWVDREGGHGQGKPLHLRVRDVADRWSFIMSQTGLRYSGS